MNPTSELIESKPNIDNNSTQDLETTLSRLHERERKFILNYHSAKSKTALLRLCGYSTANTSVIISQLLRKPSIAQALKVYEESERKRIAIRTELNGINKDTIVLKAEEIVKGSYKASDKIAALALQAKILGITKDNITVNQGVFNQFMPTQRTNNITYEQVNDTTNDKTST